MLVASYDFRAVTTLVTPLMYWSAFCVAIDPDAKDPNSTFALFFNGEKWQVKLLRFLKEAYRIKCLGSEPK